MRGERGLRMEPQGTVNFKTVSSERNSRVLFTVEEAGGLAMLEAGNQFHWRNSFSCVTCHGEVHKQRTQRVLQIWYWAASSHWLIRGARTQKTLDRGVTGRWGSTDSDSFWKNFFFFFCHLLKTLSQSLSSWLNDLIIGCLCEYSYMLDQLILLM